MLKVLETWVSGLLKIKPGKILGVGCGYGFWGFVVKARMPDVYIIGVDVDVDKLSLAKRIYDRVIAGDVRSKSFEGEFDAVLAIEVLHGFTPSDLEGVLDLLCRVGKVVIATFPSVRGKRDLL
ncbi:MAG: class I SAM-dependent methyltransferase, partial [Infirmifilum sp.]